MDQRSKRTSTLSGTQDKGRLLNFPIQSTPQRLYRKERTVNRGTERERRKTEFVLFVILFFGFDSDYVDFLSQTENYRSN